MAPSTRRALFSASLFLAACGITGSLLGGRVAAQSATDESTLRDSMKSFTDVYSIVEANYADKLDSDHIDKAIYDGAIPGMLHVLDPHSNFYDPKAFAAMREQQHGRYYGVGMTIQPQNTKVVVVAPMEGAPAYKAGIRPGDVILFVDGKKIENMDTTAVANLLKGPRGTHVTVVMAREGAPKPLTFDLVRDEIPRLTVDLAFMVKPTIGYIRIQDFQSETTAKEVQDAIDKFGPKLQGLVIDLRGNPGGLLNEAVDISDKFLQKGQIVVSQRGRAFPDQVYRAPSGSDLKFPIVVIVNRNTASAAEILSGALQDHDRGLIVGETTFGKGLVQTVFPISENTGLALTTYHYYTPSGRLIQRNYEGVSLYDYYYVRNDAAPANDTNKEVEHTDSGRVVYGGGGITPDEKIPELKSDHFQDMTLIHYSFSGFATHYMSDRKVDKDVVIDDAILEQFKAYLHQQKVDFTDKEFAENLDWTKAMIKKEIFTVQFGITVGNQVIVEWDPQVQKALTFMPEALALENHTLPSQQKGMQTASAAKVPGQDTTHP
ncbi:carboxyl-terminal processing protease [Bryocella elongata]|uniref:Carboxyl-terminal processing protease n=1 Tax=Bryocella elongata TaxID=863522 RepID=A0A1H5ZB60_9BACT|nr:S41 family peptidase [Bryocella elongata]SEG33541.1 carboxyl-terminal processing protease [Bryocella elongata]